MELQIQQPVSNSGNYVLETKTVVVCVLSRHKNPPFLCDAEYE
jgi:hypothetical protein